MPTTTASPPPASVRNASSVRRSAAAAPPPKRCPNVRPLRRLFNMPPPRSRPSAPPGRPWGDPVERRLLVDRDPLGVDDLACRGVFGAGDPFDELLGGPFGSALGHHPEVTNALVLTGLGVLQRAGDPLVADGVDAAGKGKRHEADRVFVGFDLVLYEPVAFLSLRAGGDLQRFAEEDVLEGGLCTGGGDAVDKVDRT